MKSNGSTSAKGATTNKSNGKQGKQEKQGNSSNRKGSSEDSTNSQTSKDAEGLKELFEDSLKDIYWAEKALLKAIPKMAKNATSEELVAALEEHLAVTQEQVSRLEEVFEILGKPASAKKCDAMEGLIKEAEGIMQETEEGVVRDAGIISAGQKVEHYEIATYGTLSAFAKILGENDIAALLEETLSEEKDADAKLTEVTENVVNIAAGEEDEDSEDEDSQDEEETEKVGGSNNRSASNKRKK